MAWLILATSGLSRFSLLRFIFCVTTEALLPWRSCNGATPFLRVSLDPTEIAPAVLRFPILRALESHLVLFGLEDGFGEGVHIQAVDHVSPPDGCQILLDAFLSSGRPFQCILQTVDILSG